MSKILLDTNVLIYSIDEGSKYFEKAHNIFTLKLLNYLWFGYSKINIAGRKAQLFIY